MHGSNLPENTKELLIYLRSIPTADQHSLLSAYTSAFNILKDDSSSLLIFLDYVNILQHYSEIDEIEHLFCSAKVKLRSHKTYWENYIRFEVERRGKSFEVVFAKMMEYLKVKVFPGKEKLESEMMAEKEYLKRLLTGKEVVKNNKPLKSTEVDKKSGIIEVRESDLVEKSKIALKNNLILKENFKEEKANSSQDFYNNKSNMKNIQVESRDPRTYQNSLNIEKRTNIDDYKINDERNNQFILNIQKDEKRDSFPNRQNYYTEKSSSENKNKISDLKISNFDSKGSQKVDFSRNEQPDINNKNLINGREAGGSINNSEGMHFSAVRSDYTDHPNMLQNKDDISLPKNQLDINNEISDLNTESLSLKSIKDALENTRDSKSSTSEFLKSSFYDAAISESQNIPDSKIAFDTSMIDLSRDIAANKTLKFGSPKQSHVPYKGSTGLRMSPSRPSNAESFMDRLNNIKSKSFREETDKTSTINKLSSEMNDDLIYDNELNLQKFNNDSFTNNKENLDKINNENFKNNNSVEEYHKSKIIYKKDCISQMISEKNQINTESKDKNSIERKLTNDKANTVINDNGSYVKSSKYNENHLISKSDVVKEIDSSVKSNNCNENHLINNTFIEDIGSYVNSSDYHENHLINNNFIENNGSYVKSSNRNESHLINNTVINANGYYVKSSNYNAKHLPDFSNDPTKGKSGGIYRGEASYFESVNRSTNCTRYTEHDGMRSVVSTQKDSVVSRFRSSFIEQGYDVDQSSNIEGVLYPTPGNSLNKNCTTKESAIQSLRSNSRTNAQQNANIYSHESKGEFSSEINHSKVAMAYRGESKETNISSYKSYQQRSEAFNCKNIPQPENINHKIFNIENLDIPTRNCKNIPQPEKINNKIFNIENVDVSKREGHVNDLNKINLSDMLKENYSNSSGLKNQSTPKLILDSNDSSKNKSIKELTNDSYIPKTTDKSSTTKRINEFSHKSLENAKYSVEVGIPENPNRDRGFINIMDPKTPIKDSIAKNEPFSSQSSKFDNKTLIKDSIAKNEPFSSQSSKFDNKSTLFELEIPSQDSCARDARLRFSPNQKTPHSLFNKRRLNESLSNPGYDSKKSNLKTSDAIFECPIFNTTATLSSKGNSLTFKGNELTILKKIGKGGHASVYKVMGPNLEEYALKRISIEDQESMDRVNSEVEMLKRLNGSEYVAKMIDHEIIPGYGNILFECGEYDLQKLIKSGPLDMFLIKYIWKSILSILKFIHDNGIVHKDVKPGNFIFVCGRLKAIDFGISKIVRADTTSIINIDKAGTLNYISPEQCKGKKIRRSSDIWSAGCILYNMVYQKQIHKIQDPYSVLTSMSEEKPIEYGPADPLAIESMKLCLVYDPTQRAKLKDLLSHKFLE